MSVWILVANASKAFLYHANHLHSKTLELLATFHHPESREKDMNLVSDHPGRLQTNHSARSTYEQHDPKEIEAENFAKQLSRCLILGKKQNKYEKLLIIAPPHFYGFLHKNMSRHMTHTLHIPKDYTRLSVDKLITYIKESNLSL